MRTETMKINGKNVNFKITDLGYNYGDPVRNGTVVEISNEEGFCRLSDGDAGKVGLYAYHEKNKAFVAASKAYLASLFPVMTFVTLKCYSNRHREAVWMYILILKCFLHIITQN